MPARQEIAPKEGTSENLLENPCAFYDRAMRIFELPKEKQAEEKKKFFEWLEGQWQTIDRTISAVPFNEPSYGEKPYLLRSIDISKNVKLSEYVGSLEYYRLIKIYYQEKEPYPHNNRIIFHIYTNDRKLIQTEWTEGLEDYQNGIKKNERKINVFHKGKFHYLDQTTEEV